jgi:hypothetical protein
MVRLLQPLQTVDAVPGDHLVDGLERGDDLLQQAVDADYVRLAEATESEDQTSYALTQSGRDFVAQHTGGAKEI